MFPFSLPRKPQEMAEKQVSRPQNTAPPAATTKMVSEEESGEKQGPLFVRFPNAHHQNFPPPLKLEVEETAEEMNPRNMWQVYALGGFLVLRWIWAKWMERKSRGESEDSPDEASADM